MAGRRGKNNLDIIVVLGLVIPVVVFALLSRGLPSPQWTSVTVHAILETAGLTIGIIIALFLLVINPGNQETRPVFAWIAAALIAMGILDGFHAAVLPGNTAIWLHGISSLAGGVLFTGIWWGRPIKKNVSRYVIAGGAAVVAIVAGTLSAASPALVPFTLVNSAFVFVADGTNVAGGILFVIAAAGLYLMAREEDGWGFALFSLFCISNGLAGLFFPFTISWTAAWWFWHMLRLAAYFFLLIFLYTMVVSSARRGGTMCGNGGS
jgi:hypothetical protein